MRKQKGFSLIELLIVVAIILIIAAIAIPNLLRARMAANESSAASSIRTINTAQVTYQSTYQTTGYATSLTQLGNTTPACPTPGVANACLIDYKLSAATTAANAKSGYIFSVSNAGTAGNSGYAAAGAAATWNQTGVRSFCAIEDAVVRNKVETATVAPTAYTGSQAACTALLPLN